METDLVVKKDVGASVKNREDAAGIQMKQFFSQFLEDHITHQTADFDENSVGYKLLTQFRAIQKRNTSTLKIDYDFLQHYDSELHTFVRAHFYRFEPMLRKSVAEIVEKHFKRDDEMLQDDGEKKEETFFLSFYNLPEVLRVRKLRVEHIGQLVTLSGTVTRTSEVRPELLFGVFTCLECSTLSAPIEQQFRYTEPVVCQNPMCKNRTKWQLDMQASTFVDWQRLRVQENAHEIPSGSIPRCIDVILRGDCVEAAKPGDRCNFTGCLIVVPDVSKMIGDQIEMEARPNAAPPSLPNNDGSMPQQSNSNRPKNSAMPTEGLTGLKSLGVRDMNYKMVFLACHVAQASGRMAEMDRDTDTDELHSNMTAADIQKVTNMKSDPKLYANMISSFAPNIYGHEDVKKGILLMLFGGVHKVTQEGINLRGDINVCVVGDPSTAKSQFLKYVSSLMPRAVYTSGKASSAAGLTASVVKDSENGEFTIEAGALMLADNGICCIDEFDKMDAKDQVAIHEAMEQQTISIAKAGIRATLHARTSVLAAANPIGGRYNPRKTLKANLGITPAIMSRFDLFFVIRDECEESMDRAIASHIVGVHQNKEFQLQHAIYSPEDIKLYISYARTVKPQLTPEAKKLLIESYRKLRQNDRIGSNSFRMTVRQLESLIRLSEAFARLTCESNVERYHVEESVKLLRTTITKVDKEAIMLSNEEENRRKRLKNQQESNTLLFKQLQLKRTSAEKAFKVAEQNLEILKQNLEENTKELNRLRDEQMKGDVDHTEAINELMTTRLKYDKQIQELKKSIPDLEKELQNEDGAIAQLRARGIEGDDVEEVETVAPKRTKAKSNKMRVTSEDFKSIAISLATLLHASDDQGHSMTRRELINAYIAKNSDHINNVNETERMVNLIIGRLITKDNIIIDTDASDEKKDSMDHLLLVHPNYSIE